MLTKDKCWFIENVATTERHFLNIGDFAIGRNESNDLKINEKCVSKVHCVINVTNDCAKITNHVSNIH